MRSSGSYWAAIRLMRWNHWLLVLLAVYAQKIDSPRVTQSRATAWAFLLLLSLAASIVTALVLLHRSGVPFVHRWVRDRRIIWQVCKDVYWSRRP